MFRLSAVCLIACLSTGCASIVSGQNQSVSVTTRSQGIELAGARCSLTNDKGQWYTATPGSVTVRRSFNDLAVNCSHDGLDGGVTTARSNTKAMAFGNILFGGLIGAGVDMASGAAYDYPDIIQVNMGQASAVVPTIAKDDSPAISTTLAPAMRQPASMTTATLVAVASRSHTGEYMATAERLAQTFSCGAAPKFVAKGGDFETYSVACSSGEPMVLRCDSASCREMK